VFTSGATEAANSAFEMREGDIEPSSIEHDSVFPRGDHVVPCDEC